MSDDVETERRSGPRSSGPFPWPRTGAFIVWVGIGASFFFAYLAVRKVRWGDVWDALGSSNYWWLVPALAVLATAIAVRAIRWRVLFEKETRPGYAPTLRAMLVGYLFNNILPARAGEVARVLTLHRDVGTSRAEAAGTVVIERLFDVLALLLLLFVTLPWLPQVSWLRAAGIFAIVVVVGVMLAVVLLLRYGERPLQILLRPLALLPFVSVVTLDAVAINLSRGLIGLRRLGVALAAFGWTIASWILIATSTWLLMLGFDLDLSFAAGLLVAIATGLAWIVPSAPGAVGVFEAATVVALSAFAIPESEALSYALVLHAMNFVPFILVGLIVLRVDRLFRRG